MARSGGARRAARPDRRADRRADQPSPTVPRRRAASRSRGRGVLVAVVVGAVVLAGAGVGAWWLLGRDADPADDAAGGPAATSTPLTAVDTTTLAVSRDAFCDDVPANLVREALGAPGELSAYANGEQGDLAPGLSDVAHEYSCTWTAADGTEARGWVFTPPVTRQRARGLARDVRRQRGCERLPDAPAYGAPTAAVTCDDETSVAFHGLFGDAWLSCSLTVPGSLAEDPLVNRAGSWCVAVAQAASAPPTATG